MTNELEPIKNEIIYDVLSNIDNKFIYKVLSMDSYDDSELNCSFLIDLIEYVNKTKDPYIWPLKNKTLFQLKSVPQVKAHSKYAIEYCAKMYLESYGKSIALLPEKLQIASINFYKLKDELFLTKSTYSNDVIVIIGTENGIETLFELFQKDFIDFFLNKKKDTVQTFSKRFYKLFLNKKKDKFK